MRGCADKGDVQLWIGPTCCECIIEYASTIVSPVWCVVLCWGPNRVGLGVRPHSHHTFVETCQLEGWAWACVQAVAAKGGSGGRGGASPEAQALARWNRIGKKARAALRKANVHAVLALEAQVGAQLAVACMAASHQKYCCLWNLISHPLLYVLLHTVAAVPRGLCRARAPSKERVRDGVSQPQCRELDACTPEQGAAAGRPGWLGAPAGAWASRLLWACVLNQVSCWSGVWSCGVARACGGVV